MFLGHIAAGLAAKRIAPRTSTAVLLGAPLLVDLLWPFFLLLGVEHVEIEPDSTAYTPLTFTEYPITHSLLTGLGWAALAGAIYFAFSKNRRGALVVAALVVSHWIFDWIVHQPDLPLYPGSAEYGLGLWNSVAGTVLLEAALFTAGVALYLRATRATDRQGSLSFWLLVGILVLSAIGNVLGPPPPSQTGLAIFSLILWLIPLWGIWIERHREPVPA
ncbi:MAG TPA: hypothetical protein VHG09_07225 [Longimicrobiales bacterium]|nr:hypothetical protein [Longimicrobiales bacterium]